MRLAGLSPARGRGNTPQPPRAGRCGPAIPAPACAFRHGLRFIPPHDTESLLPGHTSSAFADIRIRLLDPAHRDRARELLASHQIVVHDEPDPAVISARVPVRQRPGAAAELAAHALGRLTAAGIGVSDFALGQPSLDEVFLALTGGQAAPAPPDAPAQAPPASAGAEAIR